MYEKELKAIEKSNRLRRRELFPDNTLDFASNDYLGFGEDKTLLQRAIDKISTSKYHSPRASVLVNGYSKYHFEFEQNLSRVNSFEDCICVGSGFLANISLIEALVRKKDLLLVDEEYHASGILATKLLKGNVKFFKHNDYEDLERLLKESTHSRVIIAIEGIYSMGGDLAKREIFDLANRYEAILIVDEAHSSGVLGDKLLGIFDLYNITPKKNHIKMGTLGKSYGSYGAYILGSKEIVSFLENRAKPIIYSTALSIFDVILANEALLKIERDSKTLKTQIDARIKLTKTLLDIDIDSLILKIEVNTNERVLNIQKKLLKENFLVGAIRPPTVTTSMLRVILRLSNSIEDTSRLFTIIKTSN